MWGVPGWPGAAPVPREGVGGCQAVGMGMVLEAEGQREETWRATGCGAGGINCPNPGHVASCSPAALPAAVGHSATSGAC